MKLQELEKELYKKLLEFKKETKNPSIRQNNLSLNTAAFWSSLINIVFIADLIYFFLYTIVGIITQYGDLILACTKELISEIGLFFIEFKNTLLGKLSNFHFRKNIKLLFRLIINVANNMYYPLFSRKYYLIYFSENNCRNTEYISLKFIFFDLSIDIGNLKFKHSEISF